MKNEEQKEGQNGIINVNTNINIESKEEKKKWKTNENVKRRAKRNADDNNVIEHSPLASWISEIRSSKITGRL